MKLRVLLIMLILLVGVVFADNATNTTLGNETVSNVTLPANESEEPVAEEPELFTDFYVADVISRDAIVGDVQFSIRITNNGTAPLTNLVPVISGTGFSARDIVPIDLLLPGTSSYVIALGSLESTGTITLTIKLAGKTFSEEISVTDPIGDALLAQEKKRAQEKAAVEAAQEKAEQERIAFEVETLEQLNKELATLKNQFEEMEALKDTKNLEKYDLSEVDFTNLISYLRDAEANIIKKDVVKARASITLANEARIYQLKKIEQAPKVNRSILQVIEDNAVLFSTLAGAIIALITLYEILKKKKEALYKPVKTVEVSEDTKIVVKKKRIRKKKK